MAAGHGATSLQWPNTAVLMISTHGTIPTAEGEAMTFIVPPGKTLTKVDAVRAGICNYATNDFINEAARIITAYVDSKGAKTLETVAEELKAASKRLIRLPDDPDAKTYKQSVDRSYRIKTYQPGEEVITKYYGRAPSETLGEAFDFKMTMMNVERQPDFMQLEQTGTIGSVTRGIFKGSSKTVTLYDIVKGLPESKNIIIFDFACGALDKYDPYLARRVGRTGGKRKQTRRKRKTSRRTRR